MKLLLAALVILCFPALPRAQDLVWKNCDLHIKSSFRALSVVTNQVVWAGGSQGQIGRSLDGGKHWSFGTIKNFESLDFRSIYAFDSLHCVV
ncbi:MAG: oxidoreductase, partial [Bacteroidetes bacterium]|nr:oxidoreductase [Bacteroidota bacterium]